MCDSRVSPACRLPGQYSTQVQCEFEYVLQLSSSRRYRTSGQYDIQWHSLCFGLQVPLVFYSSFQEAKCAAAWYKDWEGNLYEFYFGRYLITLSCLSCWKNSDRLLYGEAGRSFFWQLNKYVFGDQRNTIFYKPAQNRGSTGRQRSWMGGSL